MKKKEKSHQTSSVVVFYSYIGLIVICLMAVLSSCSTTRVPVIEEDGVRWYSDSTTKKVIAKDKDTYYYLIALEDGSTYYATFGEYALIAVGDHISFNKRQTRIININK